MGLDAFDTETAHHIEFLRKHPVDRWGAPLFCRECPVRLLGTKEGRREMTACKGLRNAKRCQLVREDYAREAEA